MKQASVRLTRSGRRVMAIPDASVAVLPPSRRRPSRRSWPFGILRDRQGEESPGLEPTSEFLGQACHFDRVAKGLLPLVEFPVPSTKRVELTPRAAKLGGPGRLPILLREIGQPVDGRKIGWLEREKAFQLAAFSLLVSRLRTRAMLRADASERASSRHPAGG